LLGQGQGFADAVRQTRDRLVSMESDGFASVSDRVAEVNSTAQRLADINSQTLAGQPDPVAPGRAGPAGRSSGRADSV